MRVVQVQTRRRQVLRMEPLHHDDDGPALLVIQPCRHAAPEVLDHPVSLRGTLGAQRRVGVIHHDPVAPLAASVNYSWQSEPEILDDPNPYLPAELGLPPMHRFNAEVRWNGSRLLGSASVNAATDAFWSDVLTAGYHGYTDGYATVNGSFGVKWQSGAITTTVKVSNLFNRTVHQHIFGDLLRRTVLGEIKFRL